MESQQPGWLRRNAGIIAIPVLILAIIIFVLTSVMNRITTTYFSSESFAWAPNKTVVLLLKDHLRTTLINNFYGEYSYPSDTVSGEEYNPDEVFMPVPPYSEALTVCRGSITDGELILDGELDESYIEALKEKIGKKQKGLVEIKDSSNVITAGLKPDDNYVIRRWNRQALYNILPQIMDRTIKSSCFSRFFDPTQPYYDPRTPRDQLEKATGLTLRLLVNDSEIYHLGVPPVGGSMEYLNEEMLPQFPEIRVVINSLIDNEKVFTKIGKRMNQLQGLAFILLIAGIILLFFRKVE